MLVAAQVIGRGWLNGTTLLASEISLPNRTASVIGVMSALVDAAAGSLVDWLGYSVLFTLAACECAPRRIRGDIKGHLEFRYSQMGSTGPGSTPDGDPPFSHQNPIELVQRKLLGCPK